MVVRTNILITPPDKQKMVQLLVADRRFSGIEFKELLGNVFDESKKEQHLCSSGVMSGAPRLREISRGFGVGL